MESKRQDQDIVGLLTKLKNVEGQYPEHMLLARRQMYLRRMAEIGIGIPADPGFETAPQHRTPPPVTPATSTMLESALLLAILVETSAVAYFYRDQLSDFFERMTNEPRVREISPLPVAATSSEIQGVTPSPALAVTVPSATLAPSVSPTDIPATVPGTPMPGLADESSGGAGETATMGETTPNSSSPGSGPSQGESTPAPNTKDKQNQGNHYGQTPKPERTIESNSNSSNKGTPQDPGTDDRKNNNGNNGDSGSTNDTGGESPGSSTTDSPRPPKNK